MKREENFVKASKEYTTSDVHLDNRSHNNTASIRGDDGVFYHIPRGGGGGGTSVYLYSQNIYMVHIRTSHHICSFDPRRNKGTSAGASAAALQTYIRI